MKTNFFSAENINSISKNLETANQAKLTYLKPIVRDGLQHYITNLNSEYELVSIGNKILPIVVCNGCECTLLPIINNQTEDAAKSSRRIRDMGLDRGVFLNQWLLFSSPSLQLGKKAIESIRDSLVNRFPDRPIFFMGLDFIQSGPTIDYVVDCGFNLSWYSMYYLFDDIDETNRDLKKDFNMLTNGNCKIDYRDSLTDEEAANLLDLYVSHYGGYNKDFPRLTERWLKLVASSSLFDLVTYFIDKNNRAWGSSIYDGGQMIGNYMGKVGRDTYRIDIAQLLRTANSKGLLYNGSTGIANEGDAIFKRLRGARPSPLFIASYSDHLGDEKSDVLNFHIRNYVVSA